jgi:hypothetical protein
MKKIITKENKMKKIITATLSFVTTFALLAGVAGISNTQASAFSSSYQISDNSWDSTTNQSQKLVVGASGTNRKVDITVTNTNQDITYSFMPRELTGGGSFDMYFNCAGNEVSSLDAGCIYTLEPHKSVAFTVKLENSSWWKDRDGVYLAGLYRRDIDKNVEYTMTTEY